MITQISYEKIYFSLLKKNGQEKAAHSVDIMFEWSFNVNVVFTPAQWNIVDEDFTTAETPSTSVY